MSNKHKKWYVVVVDDRKEFAIHVLRYLDRALSLGTTDDWMPELKVWPFLDGQNRFCWIRADGESKTKLYNLIKKIDEGWNIFVILDVVGKRETSYDPAKLLFSLERAKRYFRGEICSIVVSAYQIGVRLKGKFEVRSKSRSTLREIRQRLYVKDQKYCEKLFNGKQFLVTGAGFEFINPRGGFGMPPTNRLMEAMTEPFVLLGDNELPNDSRREVIYLRPKKDGLPYPVGGDWESIVSIEDAAADGQLDLYWDILLAAELSRSLGEFSRMKREQREKTAYKALLGERNMREAFRRAVREHDWGHLNQSIAAAELPCDAWFTTNYTRFADRAIALIEPYGWRIISTAAEASTAIKEDSWQLNVGHRYLFKLHGDVGHLHTMAIAGHDKDSVSPLSVPIDDLHQVYASAERFLRFALREEHGPVVWHIVGHALGDHKLLNLIGDACELTRGSHLFLIVNVNPVDPQKALEDNLSKRKRGGKLTFQYRIESRRLLAAEYMTRLARCRNPVSADLESLSKWFRTLPLGERELEASA